METLIIILIAVLIINTCVGIYAYFIDLSSKHYVSHIQECLASSQKAFLEKENRLVKTLDIREEQYKQLIIAYNELNAKYKDIESSYNSLKNSIKDKDTQQKL